MQEKAWKAKLDGIIAMWVLALNLFAKNQDPKWLLQFCSRLPQEGEKKVCILLYWKQQIIVH